jgi:hypothetical protein
MTNSVIFVLIDPEQRKLKKLYFSFLLAFLLIIIEIRDPNNISSLRSHVIYLPAEVT